MSKYALIAIILSGCAPISHSIPKDKLCSDTHRYDSVNIGDRSYDVETKMSRLPDSEIVNGMSMTQIYVSCRELKFVFMNDEVISKSAE